MDCGCTVQGYQSDISRTWVHGQPTADASGRSGRPSSAARRSRSRPRKSAYRPATSTMPCAPTMRARAGAGLQAARALAPDRARHRSGRPRARLSRARRHDAARGRHVLLRRARHLYPRRIRRPPRGLLVHDRKRCDAVHRRSQSRSTIRSERVAKRYHGRLPHAHRPPPRQVPVGPHRLAVRGARDSLSPAALRARSKDAAGAARVSSAVGVRNGARHYRRRYGPR